MLSLNFAIWRRDACMVPRNYDKTTLSLATFGSSCLSVLKSVEPKVRLQGYGYNPFCSHSSRCLAVLV